MEAAGGRAGAGLRRPLVRSIAFTIHDSLLAAAASARRGPATAAPLGQLQLWAPLLRPGFVSAGSVDRWCCCWGFLAHLMALMAPPGVAESISRDVTIRAYVSNTPSNGAGLASQQTTSSSRESVATEKRETPCRSSLFFFSPSSSSFISYLIAYLSHHSILYLPFPSSSLIVFS